MTLANPRPGGCTEAEFAGILLAFREMLPAEPRDLTELLEELGSLHRLLASSESIPMSRRSRTLLTYLRAELDDQRANALQAGCDSLFAQRSDVNFISVLNSAYPGGLRSAFDRPPFLFAESYGGYVPNSGCIAVIGSRQASEQHRAVASRVAYLLAKEDRITVSGLANGVDTAAHKGALAAGGQTWAVLGHGIAVDVSPTVNTDLARTIRKQGCIFSQYHPSAPATATTFVARNSVITGMASAVFVVSAMPKSGTWSALEGACRQGRKLLLWKPSFAKLGGSIYSSLIALPNMSMCSSVDEVVESALRTELSDDSVRDHA